MSAFLKGMLEVQRGEVRERGIGSAQAWQESVCMCVHAGVGAVAQERGRERERVCVCGCRCRYVRYDMR